MGDGRKNQGDGGNQALSNQAAKGGQCPVCLGSQRGGEHPVRELTQLGKENQCV